MRFPRGVHRWSLEATIVLMALYERTAYAADYWEQPLRYILLDALLCASPLTAIFTVMAAANPRWRTRPRHWRTNDATPSYAHRWLRNHFLTLSALSALTAAGLVVLGLHVMSVL